MSDFAPGDVVVCVRAGLGDASGTPVPFVVGHMYRVAAVRRHRRGYWGVAISGVRPSLTGFYKADRFRKIRPASESFTRQMRALRPIKTRVEA